MTHPEPGDIVEVTRFGGGHDISLVVFDQGWSSYGITNILDVGVRRLVDGYYDIVASERCRVIIKRYHVVVGMSVHALNEDLRALRRASALIVGEPRMG